MTNDTRTPLDELLTLREAHLGKALSIAHGKPLHITHGSMQYLYAADGTRYLDLRAVRPEGHHVGVVGPLRCYGIGGPCAEVLRESPIETVSYTHLTLPTKA